MYYIIYYSVFAARAVSSPLNPVLMMTNWRRKSRRCDILTVAGSLRPRLFSAARHSRIAQRREPSSYTVRPPVRPSKKSDPQRPVDRSRRPIRTMSETSSQRRALQRRRPCSVYCVWCGRSPHGRGTGAAACRRLGRGRQAPARRHGVAAAAEIGSVTITI